MYNSSWRSNMDFHRPWHFIVDTHSFIIRLYVSCHYLHHSWISCDVINARELKRENHQFSYNHGHYRIIIESAKWWKKVWSFQSFEASEYCSTWCSAARRHHYRWRHSTSSISCSSSPEKACIFTRWSSPIFFHDIIANIFEKERIWTGSN